MISQALYRKWRPQVFEDVAGQEHVTRTLRNALETDRVAHAYLFAGPRGTGKTTSARLLAKAVSCTDEAVERRPCNSCHICLAVNEGRLLDLVEIDAASNTGVDDIRSLRDKVNFRPGEARMKFYIIDEVHMLSNSAFNALLKTLEEPPPHVIFVLATTEPEKIPATVTSRCQRFDFRRINVRDIVARLRHIVGQEGLAADEAALEFIAQQGEGSMRDAISLLDQIAAYGSEQITLEQVQKTLGTVATQAVTELVECLIGRDVAGGISVINEVVAGGGEPRQFTREIVAYLRALLLVKVGPGVELLNQTQEVLATMRTQATQIDQRQLVRAAHLFSDAVREIKHGILAIPQLPLELAFLDATVQPSPQAVPASGLDPAPWPAKAAAGRLDLATSERQVQSTPDPKAENLADPGVLDLAAVERQWSQVLAEIRSRNKMAYGLFNSGKPVASRGEAVFLSFQSDLLKERAEQQRNLAIVEEAAQLIFGKPIAIKCVVGEMRPSPAPSEGEQDRPLEEDPLVKAALDMGGEIVGSQST
jgi:DNA polymerase III subunit gamma/tau